jgi:hypothetical protein
MMGYDFPIWLNWLAGVIMLLGIPFFTFSFSNSLGSFFLGAAMAMGPPVSIGYSFSMITSMMGYHSPVWLDVLVGIVFTLFLIGIVGTTDNEKKNQ